ncbi:MAG: hypothetical protein Ta2G_08220 [Termitinemataceae bacterium]|nr:MAG: hypothetical protein Ta2G_08220 [Termitinemataceae bacterium]
MKSKIIMKSKIFFAVNFVFCALLCFAESDHPFDSDPTFNVEPPKKIHDILDAENKQDFPYDKTVSPYRELKEITDGEDFGKKKESWSVRFKEQQKADDDDDLPNLSWLEWFKNISSYVLRFLIVLGLSALIIILIIIAKKLKAEKKIKSKYTKEIITASEQLAASVLLQNAKDLFANGRERDAWAMCFRAINRSFSEKQIVFKNDATEYECYNMLAKNHSYYAPSYLSIMQDWIKIAYANTALQKTNFENAVSFCQDLIAEEKADTGKAA